MDRLVSVITFALVTLASQAQAQLAAPYGVSQLDDGSRVVVYWYYPAVNETTLAGIDDEPHSYILYGTANCGAKLACVFDLPSQLCAIEAVEMRLWPDDPFPRLPGDEHSAFGLCVDSVLSNDTTSEHFWSQDDLTAGSGTANWLRFPVRKILCSDSVVMEFNWLDGTPTAPLPAVVYTTHHVNSYIGGIKNGIMEWSKLFDVAALMRVQVGLADVYESRAIGSAVPDSFSVFLFDTPEEKGMSEVSVTTISDSLHIAIEHLNADGKFVAVAAWHGNAMGPKSELIQIDAVTSVEEQIVPSDFRGPAQNYPNPFNAETTIESNSGKDVVVIDLLGRNVCRLQARSRGENGRYFFDWNGRKDDGSQLASGVYFYRQDGEKGVRKLVLLK